MSVTKQTIAAIALAAAVSLLGYSIIMSLDVFACVVRCL